MATAEHCIYCFESLAAHLEQRKSLSLADIEKLYPKYRQSNNTDLAAGASEGLKKQIPALERLADQSSGSNSSLPSSGSSMSLDADTPDTSTSSLPTEREAITESPLFVTWNTVSPKSGNTNLRGCIGTFEAQELEDGISSYAITSAIHDMRFNPISKRELPSLEVAVTLLTDFEECDDAMDWELGTHGIRISFTERGRRYGSTYLPDVAPEQGWDKEETIVSLLRKAGWVGKKDKWHELDLKVVRYQGKKEHLRYPEFKQFRDWYSEHSKA
ncbi:hypothetical protein PFICI_03847 [Pestalotiopsis fici W106-1]|uniref:AMMECR1 domain-containing protein n=1 Tax=Pestalotiopsis fici (strain W106-1 / CGMCC3.15140) TaxID=1229662 RepID=W3XK33_PESFW|nr:uncharacterized protein PFICI_03847 [Pestalotiopsis fici W106-1]ETS85822.1 hypothetical protein PFICI_03847 [Pestalotiopsis fici W106-1]